VRFGDGARDEKAEARAGLGAPAGVHPSELLEDEAMR
jgi:hypothetical protein